MGTLTEEGAVGSETGPVRGSCATEAAVGRACGRSGGTSGSVHVRGAVASAISAVRIGSESPVTRPEGKEKAESQPTVAKSRPGLLTQKRQTTPELSLGQVKRNIGIGETLCVRAPLCV